MPHGAIDAGATCRAIEGGAGVARAGDQHGGGGGRFVARFWPVAASSLSLSRAGPDGRAGAGDYRRLGDDYAQASEHAWRGIASLRRHQRAEPERDRTPRNLELSVGSARTWLSGGTSVMSVLNTVLTVCSSPSWNRSIGSLSPTGFGLSAMVAS